MHSPLKPIRFRQSMARYMYFHEIVKYLSFVLSIEFSICGIGITDIFK